MMLVKNQGIVTVPVLNLYSKPDLRSQLASQALYGWKVTILEKFHNFHLIETFDGYRGWADIKNLSPVLPNLPKTMVKLIFNAVPIYRDASVKSQVICLLPFEVELPVVEELQDEGGRWIQVALYNENFAWIQRGHVAFFAKALTLSEMLRLSKQFLGIPYIWGGISSFGFDCSGFMQMLWRQRNIFLPRDAKDQCNFAPFQQLAWKDIAPGDLIFFGTSASQIQHVGLYLGNEKMIHASVKPIPIVQESHLEDESFKRFSYQTAKRMIG